MIEVDLQKIKKLGYKNEKENWDFSVFLKGSCFDDEFDNIVFTIYQEVVVEIDCKICASCCKELDVLVSEKDVEDISQVLGMSVEDFIQRYAVKNYIIGEYYDGFILKQKPCVFLKGDRCEYYDFRPNICKVYPSLDRSDVLCRLNGMMMDYSVCPIVFNVYEKLKEHYRAEYLEYKQGRK